MRTSFRLGLGLTLLLSISMSFDAARGENIASTAPYLAQATQSRESSLSEAEVLIAEEQYDQAETILTNLLVRQPHPSSVISERDANIYLLLGEIAWHQLDFAEAKARYRDVLKRLPSSIPALVRLGLIAYEENQLTRAADHWQAALNIDNGAADALWASAIALYDLGERKAALEQGELALIREVRYVDPEFLKQNLWGEKAIARTEVLAAKVYENVQAKNAAAERLLAILTDIETLSARVQDLFQQGQALEAIPLAEKVVRLTRQAFAKDHIFVAQSANNLALLYDEQGRYREAESLYLEASEVLETLFEGDHPEIATNLNNLAALYDNQGRFDEAESSYRQALAMRQRLFEDDHPDIAIVLNNLGFLYDNQKNYALAQSFHRQALEMLQRLFEGDRPEVATSLNNLGASYDNQGRYNEAESLYRQALAMRQRLFEANHPDIAIGLNNLATLHYNTGQFAAAADGFERSLAMLRQRFPEAHPWIAFNISNLATVYEATGEYERSLEFSLQAAELEEHMLAENLLAGSERQKLQFLGLFQRRTDSAISFHLQSSPTEPAANLAFTTLLRRKGRVLDVMSESLSRLRQRLNPGDRKLLEQLTTIYQRISSSNARGETERAHLQESIEEAISLQKDLFDRNADFRLELTPVTFEDVRDALPKDAALIEFVEYAPFDTRARTPSERYGSSRYAAYILLPDGTLLWQDLGDSAVMNEAIRSFRLNLRKSWEASGRDLYDRLFAPLQDKLGEATHLLIAPDSALNLLPFAALIDSDDNYLLERYRITYLTSGRDLLRLDASETSFAPPVLLADPVFESTLPAQLALNPKDHQRSASLAGVSFNALSFAQEEAEAIASLFPNMQILLGAEATENALKQVRNPQFLHVATHGFFEGDWSHAIEPRDSLAHSSPYRGENLLLLSGLALAGFNDRSSGSEDGVLTALEVTNLDLQGTELVVLSACDTGLGDIERGEGVRGLRRAFALAGAESQVMSLWNVDDESTKELMANYYKRLKAGEGRSEALRRVQLDMLNDPYWESPYFWAAFIPTGNWKPLTSSPA